MDTNLDLLEDRIGRLIERLRLLSAEVSRLDAENRELRQRVAELEDAQNAPRVAWAVPPAQVASALREAIRELREV